MPEPSETPESSGMYADSLRALGQYLDPFRPSSIEVIDRGERIEVPWCSPDHHGSEKHFEVFGVKALCAFGEMIGASKRSGARLGIAELLSVLGWHLDKMHAENVSVMETADGFRVSARTHGIFSGSTRAMRSWQALKTSPLLLKEGMHEAS